MAENLERWYELDQRVMEFLDGRTLTPTETAEYIVMSGLLEAAGRLPNCPCHGDNGWLSWDSLTTGNWGTGTDCAGCTDENGVALPVADRLTLSSRIGVMNAHVVLDAIEDFEEALAERAV